MSNVYKICYTVKNEIRKINIFIGGRIPEDKSIDVNQLYKLEPESEVFNGIFSPDEQSYLASNPDIILNFVPMEIHPDDTIETIKKKYVAASPEDPPTYSGIYMYGITEIPLDAQVVYQQLTQDGQIELTKERMVQFLLNIEDINVDELPDKDMYDYEDVIALNLGSREKWSVAEPIGQKFLAVEKTYPYTVDPFNALEYDPFLIQHTSDLLTTTNQHLLLQSPMLKNNTLFACHAVDVLQYAKESNLSQEATISIYYPYLRNADIMSLADYEAKREVLINETNELVTDESWRANISNVDLFYDVSSKVPKEGLILEQGISKMRITIAPSYSFNLPLDVVFKLISADKNTPLIKYNPARRQEKIYRLYANQVSTNGTKIPYLSKGTIFKLMKVLARNKEVSVYIQPDIQNVSPLIVGFFDDGRVEILVDTQSPITTDALSDLIHQTCNPVIDKVSEYLIQSGYSMPRFENLNAQNVSISETEMVIKVSQSKKLKLSSMTGCLSSVFNIITDDTSKGAELRFKRVANYNEMDSQEAYIVEALNAGARDLDVIKGLQDNFRIKKEADARKKLVDFVSRQQVVQQAFKNRRVKIKSNPGFMTIMVRERFEANLIISISGIDNVGYLTTIPVYINGLMGITQKPTETGVPEAYIERLCKGKVIQDEQKKEDLVAQAEEPAQVQAIVFNQPVDEPDADMQQGLLGMLIGDDSDSEDESDEESDDDQGGGADTPDEIVRDITGMSLSNPNPISNRLMTRQPALFLTSVPPGYKSYSRSCQSNLRRQPVILSESEKEKADREHPGSYENAISYQSEPGGDRYYYICPRYWSLKDNMPLTQEQVDSGKYGDLIPLDANVVPPGGGVYQLDSSYYRDDKGDYIGTHPGFMKPDKHPDGKCVPCCYKSWVPGKQEKMREKCEVGNRIPAPGAEPAAAAQEPGATKKKKLKIKAAEKFDEYVKGPEKFPLEPGRIGYLPIVIQRFLNTDNKTCQISSKNTNIKKNTPCLVRLGVEKDTKQSFIGAIAAIYADLLAKKTVPSINEMKTVLLNAFDIDRFMTLQNGNLTDTFDDGSEVDITQFSRSVIYNSMNIADPSQLAVMKKIVRAYNNYRNFISSDDVEIDYRYLWDLVCNDNPGLFPKGLNLVIIEAPEDDITGNVNVICPSNHYSKTLFDVNKMSSILIKKDGLYEPIISYEDTGKSYAISRRFSLKYKDLLPSLRITLETIKSSVNEKCMPLPSKPKVYKFATNISLERVLYLAKLKKYSVINQMMNYSGKVIALLIQKRGVNCIVPCFPSAPILGEAPYKWIDEYNAISYQQTKDFLTRFAKDTKGEVPVAPSVKVTEDGLITGIITQSNQFVPIDPPIQDTFGDDLISLDDSNYVEVNKDSLTSTTVDEERIEYMKKIKLESGFFNTFRNMIRMLLGQYEHKKARAAIESIVEDEGLTYYSKLRQVNAKIRSLLERYVRFTDLGADIIGKIQTVTNCHTLDTDKCGEKPYCLTTDERCLMLIPRENLISGINNEAMYYGRLSDEIVRYSRIRSFIFEPRAFLAFSDLKYNLNDDEIIMLQSLLTQDYFDDLVPRVENQFVRYNTYDTAEPMVGQVYNDVVNIDKNTKTDAQAKCGKPKLSSVAGKWSRSFPEGSKELIFPDSPASCTFEIIQTLLQVMKKPNLTQNQLREILGEEYAEIVEGFQGEILGLLRTEGKSLLAKQIELGQISIADAVMLDTYYLTTIDLWILARKFDIPLVLYSATRFPENEKTLIVTNATDGDNFFFIKVPGVKVGTAPKYRLLINGTNPLINVDEISMSVATDIEQQRAPEDILVDFITRFKAPAKKKLKIVKKISKASEPAAAEAKTAEAKTAKAKKPKKLKRKLKLKA